MELVILNMQFEQRYFFAKTFKLSVLIFCNFANLKLVENIF